MSTVALHAEGLVVRFGGITAVDGFSLQARTGEVTGLIGPNGAGKTTTFNACSGVIRPNEGRVDLLGHDITTAGPAERARLGLGRTFQRMELFASMTVRENVALGREAGYAGRHPWRQLWSPAAQRAEIAAAAAEALERCGISDHPDRQIGTLSTGQRRLVELARVVAGRFSVLLLDEPCSGLDRTETAALGDLLLELVTERDLAILLVEHDMEVALRVCRRLFVLDFGRPIFDGTPAEVRASDIVRKAYLGDEDEALAPMEALA
jgi:ABC-type branched-subunit amino acid transport system ATPase component